MQRQKTRERKIVWSIELLKMKRHSKSGPCWEELPIRTWRTRLQGSLSQNRFYLDWVSRSEEESAKRRQNKGVIQAEALICLNAHDREKCDPSRSTDLYKCLWQKERCVVQDGRISFSLLRQHALGSRCTPFLLCCAEQPIFAYWFICLFYKIKNYPASYTISQPL